ncbi:phosphoglucomutase [Thermogladius sp. 4427co]|uniref:phosphoglucomutase n=1 Tax=Thermogladius sp. 4427co TaxID=3450718 RepID=UPI003F78C8C8
MLKVYDNRFIGVPNEDFTPDEAARLGEKIGSWLGKGSIVVSGRDYNPSSRMLKRAFTAGLMSTGVEVMDFHESLSGEISFSIKRFGVKGGFLFTTSHSVPDSVMLKLFRSPGYEVLASNMRLDDIEVRRVGLSEVGWVMYSEYIHKLYVSGILSFVKVDEIASRNFKIVVHTAYSPADVVIPDILKSLGIDYVLLQNIKTKAYESKYPFLKEIEQVKKIVEATGAELGVVFNNDASSMSVVDSEGRVLLPDEVAYAISLGAPREASIVVEPAAPRLLKRMLEEKGVKLIEVGDENNLINYMAKSRPYLAYRVTGHVAIPLFSLGYDSIITLVKLLECLAVSRSSLGELVSKYRSMLYEKTGSLGIEDARVEAGKQKWTPTPYGYVSVNREKITYYVFEPGEGSFTITSPK